MLRRARIGLPALLLAVVAAACGPSGPQWGAVQAPDTTASQPPDFELRALDGSSVRLSEHLGKQVVLIDFWATYCEPCLRSMPGLDALYAKYKAQGFLVLGVSIDGADSLLSVRSDVQKLGITFPILLDQDTRVVALYNPKTSAPFSVLIGKDGRVLARREGYANGAEDALEREVKAALR